MAGLGTTPDPSSVRLPGPWRHLDIRANGIRFHAVEHETSDPSAPLVLLLHGFGEFWWTWRHQLPALAAAGCRAVAIDLRGYGDTDKPPRGYDGWTLADDTDGLVRALGHTSAVLVGHADGGLVCWATAALRPKTVRAAVVIASPHPHALRRAALRNRRQRAAFLPDFLHNQLPRLAERRLTRRGGAGAEALLTTRSGATWRRTPDFDVAVEHCRSAVRIPGAAFCSLEYRRWAFRSQWRADGARFRRLLDARTRVPIVAVRGADDAYILEPTVAASARWAPDWTSITVPAAGHYVHEEAPEATTAAITDLLDRLPT